MIKELTTTDFDTEINADIPVVVEFYTPTCVHCKKLAKVLEDVSEELEGQALIAKVNAAEESILQSRYDVVHVPTLLFIKKGEVKNRLEGEVHPLVLKEEIKKLKN